MTRTHVAISSFATVIFVLFFATFAFASGYLPAQAGSYDYNLYTNNNSIDHSYNNYDSYNHAYGYNPSGGGYYDSGYYNSYGALYKPSCALTVQNYNGTTGYDRSITLVWSSSYATSAYLSGVGSVGVNGAQVMYYPYNQTYTLTVYGPGGSTTCSANNAYFATQYYNNYGYNSGYAYDYNSYAYPLYNYSNYSAYSYPATYTYPATHSYPTYSYVPLSQVPYTGFDYGPVGNSLYWLGMILVALCGAYLIVYYRGWQPATLPSEVVFAARNQLRFVRLLVK